ncbi:MAG TPA: antitoxin [Candidatus Hydrogenedentes bacterium]|nr:antitoxin [Candidatus Hydrogenedentota bacterium]
MKLTTEEQAILAAVETGEWRSVQKLKEETAAYRTAAKAAQHKDKRVNIRMTESDLVRFKRKAAEEGLPYQTLMSSVLHKYING